MNKPIKIYPKNGYTYDGRRVIYMMCEPLQEDLDKRAEDLREVGINNRIGIVAKDISSGKVHFFNSMQEASEQLGIPKSSISRCCSGVQNTAKGFIIEKV